MGQFILNIPCIYYLLQDYTKKTCIDECNTDWSMMMFSNARQVLLS